MYRSSLRLRPCCPMMPQRRYTERTSDAMDGRRTRCVAKPVAHGAMWEPVEAIFQIADPASRMLASTDTLARSATRPALRRIQAKMKDSGAGCAADGAGVVLRAQIGTAAAALRRLRGLLPGGATADGAGGVIGAERHPAVATAPLGRLAAARCDGLRVPHRRDHGLARIEVRRAEGGRLRVVRAGADALHERRRVAALVRAGRGDDRCSILMAASGRAGRMG